MADLIARYNQLKQNKSFDIDDIRRQIDSIPKVDNESILNAIHSSLMNVFARHYEIEANKKENLVADITTQIATNIANLAQSSEKSYNNIVSSLESVSSKLEQAIKNIPETDLSGLDRAIKGIKPTDVSDLRADIQNLSTAIISLKSKKPPKQQKLDLTPVIEAIKTPMKVEFKIEYDSWDYPVKVIATETK